MIASIVIPTYNGALKIPALLKALASQTFKDFEVLVVIDGSTDNTHEIVTGHLPNFKYARIIQQPNKGRAATRNRGVQESKGEIVIFLDDDVEPLNNLVELHIQHHQKTDNSILVGQLFMDNRDNKNDFYDYRYFIEQKWDASFPKELKTVSFDQYRFTSQNLSLNKQLFHSLNGFDERLSDSEDFDFSMRALLKEIPIYYDKTIFSWHRDFTNLSGYIKRLKAYKNSKKELLMLHTDYYQLHPRSFEISQNKISAFKNIISRFFIYNSIWTLLLSKRLFTKIVPKKIRFRLYEIIVYSSTLHD